MLTSEVASGIPQCRTVEGRVEHGVEAEVAERDRGRDHGDCRLKKARFSISIAPLNGRPSAKAASAPATTGVWSGVNAPRW